MYCALAVTAKRSVDELFIHYFHKLSASGALPPGLHHPWTSLGTFIPRSLICPPREKILQAPMPGSAVRLHRMAILCLILLHCWHFKLCARWWRCLSGRKVKFTTKLLCTVAHSRNFYRWTFSFKVLVFVCLFCVLIFLTRVSFFYKLFCVCDTSALAFL